MELSRDINVAFKTYTNNLSNAYEYKIDLTVNVLSMAYWPTYQPMEVTVPTEMAKYQVRVNPVSKEDTSMAVLKVVKLF